MNNVSTLPLQVVAMLFNSKTETYHSIIFVERPFPGEPKPNQTSSRYRSHGHHTEGNKDREEAIKFARENYIPKLPGCVESFGGDLLWSGEDAPSMTLLFGYVNDEFRPLA